MKTLSIFIALSFLGLTGIHAETARPNILVIMVDDLGYGDLSSYGGTDIKTPQIDQLMSEGLRFNEFYANCCVCSPTRAAFLSGRYPELVGIPGVVRTSRASNWGHLTPESIMLSTLFQKAGYHTSLIGKWHLGLREPNRPNQRGFDTFHGWLGDMMDDYWKHRRHGINYMRKNEAIIDPTEHATDLFTDWSIAELKIRAKEERPFFMFLAYNAPHSPINPPKDWLEKVVAREPNMTPTRAGIVALIEHLDNGIGNVLKTLDELKLKDNTIVVFTSDNGGKIRFGASNGALRSDKTHIYEGGIKVPTCTVWPNHIKAGQQSDFQALTMDILPTLADICKIEIGHTVEGQSFKELLTSGTQAAFQRPVFHMWLQKTTKEAVRLGDWKLTRDKHDTPYELYNIKKDFGETTNMANSMPEKVIELSKALDAHMQRSQAIPWQRPEITSK